MMQVYVVDALNELSDEKFANYLKLVDDERKDRIMRFHFMADKKRSLVGTLLTGYVIFKAFGVSPGDIIFEKNKYGKPFVKGRSDIHFNISHSGNYVVAAVGENSVGIDVQEHKSGNLDIADRFFSNEERAVLDAVESSLEEQGGASHNLIKDSSPDERQELKRRMFYDMWSLKEAYIKCIGMGLSKPLDEFGILEKNGEYKLYDDGVENDKYYFRKYTLSDDYSLCVCAMDDCFPDEFVQVGIDELALNL